MQQPSTIMMMTINAFQCCNALDVAPLKKTVRILATSIEEPYQLLQYLGNVAIIMEIKLVNYIANVIVSQCISYLKLMHACMHG